MKKPCSFHQTAVSLLNHLFRVASEEQMLSNIKMRTAPTGEAEGVECGFWLLCSGKAISWQGVSHNWEQLTRVSAAVTQGQLWRLFWRQLLGKLNNIDDDELQLSVAWHLSPSRCSWSAAFTSSSQPSQWRGMLGIVVRQHPKGYPVLIKPIFKC